ncbi:hypothetical protein PMAYCL1PPCAC_11683, partial [Pristionchus mayeri]
SVLGVPLHPPHSPPTVAMLTYVIALVPLTLACAPGTGPITANPTMQFTYSPPLAWTWNTVEKAVGGQALNQQSALNRVNSDIESAVKKAVESMGYSTSGVTVNNAVDAKQILVLPDYSKAKACVADNYVPEGLTVTKKCAADEAPSVAPSFNITGSIRVTSPVALAQSNWENIAIHVYATLTNEAAVKFYGLIEVKA